MPSFQKILIRGFILMGLMPLGTQAGEYIQACVKTASGGVRIVSSVSECRPYERGVSWSRSGETGERGAPGEPGPPGATGPSVVVVDAGGENVGTLAALINSNLSLVLSDRNYAFILEAGGAATITQRELLYQGGDCQGPPAFVLYSDAFFTLQKNHAIRGEVFLSEPDSKAGVERTLYYVPRDAEPLTGDFSRLEDNRDECVLLGGTKGYPVSPNDPAVTGVSRSEFQVPVRFERR